MRKEQQKNHRKHLSMVLNCRKEKFHAKRRLCDWLKREGICSTILSHLSVMVHCKAFLKIKELGYRKRPLIPKVPGAGERGGSLVRECSF